MSTETTLTKHRAASLRKLPDGRTIIWSNKPVTATMSKAFISPWGEVETVLLDMRGWGFLTGSGWAALGLPDEEAEKIQDDTFAWIIEAINEKRERELRGV